MNAKSYGLTTYALVVHKYNQIWQSDKMESKSRVAKWNTLLAYDEKANTIECVDVYVYGEQ
jgi:hypothetical protein